MLAALNPMDGSFAGMVIDETHVCHVLLSIREKHISKSSLVVGFGSRYFFIASLIVIVFSLRFRLFSFSGIQLTVIIAKF